MVHCRSLSTEQPKSYQFHRLGWKIAVPQLVTVDPISYVYGLSHIGLIFSLVVP